MAPIVVIRHQPNAPLGVAADALDEAGIPWDYLDVYEDVEWPDLEAVDGLIALGGEMNVDNIDDHPFLDQGRALLAAAVDRETPVFGICLGAQLLARALGAEVRPSPVREVGFIEVCATEAGLTDPVLTLFAPATSVFQFHEDAFELPDGAELLFTGEAVPNQAFRFGSSAYGVQWHMEVDSDIIADWCDETPALETEWGTTKRAVLAEAERFLPEQLAACHKAITAFAALCQPNLVD
jgi:GMP synthase (glutamine-hydrolysing)